nr:low-density lipoprotein receptor-like [Lytechinus pictus]
MVNWVWFLVSRDCNNGVCISSQWRCDGMYRDCMKGEDEENCGGTNFIDCGKSEFRCNDGSCISKDYVCDGRYQDCEGGDDEISCPSSCGAYEYECESGACVPASRMCDGRNDCPSGSDEITLNCNDFQNLEDCDPHYQFRCYVGNCISVYAVCDDHNDCLGGEDEALCPGQQGSNDGLSYVLSELNSDLENLVNTLENGYDGTTYNAGDITNTLYNIE